VGKFESDRNIDHSRVSAEIANKFLLTLPLTDKQVNDICYCIARHCDGEAGYDYIPISETDVVEDADNIDRFGRYRIIQALHYDDFDTMSLTEKISYCNQKIEKLNRYTTIDMGTPTGKKLFNEACKIQLNYFQMLLEEFMFTSEDVTPVWADEALKNR
jgi:HD superfamily phosphodiesterase